MVSWRDITKALDLVDDTFLGNQVEDGELVIADPLKEALSFIMDNPLGKRAIGNARYANAKFGMGALPDDIAKAARFAPLIGMAVDKPSEYDEVVKAYEEGFGGQTGGRAAWEATAGQKNALVRGINDIAADPLTWATMGVGSTPEVIAKGSARVAAGGAKNVLTGRAMQAGAKAVQAVNIPDKVTDSVLAGTFGELAKTPVGRWVTELSPREKVRKNMDRLIPFYKTANQILNGTYADEGLQAARDAGSKAVLQPGTDVDTTAQNAWNALRSGRPVNEQDVGDVVFERGPNAKKSMVDVANETGQASINAMKTLQSLPTHWPAGSDRATVEKLLTRYGQTAREQKAGIVPLDPADITNALDAFDTVSGFVSDPFTSRPEDAFKAMFGQQAKLDTTVPGLGKDGNDMLHTVFSVGRFKDRTYFDALKELEAEYDVDKQAVLDAVGPGAWKFRERPEVVEQMLKDSGSADALKAWKKWDAEDVDLLYHPREESAFAAFEPYAYGDAGIETVRKKGRLSAIASVWKGQALLSPRYHASNVTSAYFNTVLTQGFRGLPDPREFWRQVRYLWREDPNKLDTFYADSPINDTLERIGRARINPNIGQGAISSLMGSNSKEQVEKAFGRIVGQPLGKIIGPTYDFNRRMGVAIDAAARGNVWDTKLWSTIYEGEDAVRKEVMDTAAREGLAIAPGIELLPFHDPAKALGYYRGLGFSEGKARHLSRELAGLINKADKGAIEQVHKGLFSYYRTRTDDVLSKVIPFHYYASRSTALYFEAMARNPILMSNFAKMAEEMFQDYENSGMNARQKGWITVMRSHAGFAMLMNPDALFGFTRSMGLMGDNYENDETALGGLLKWMNASGFGLYPWVNGMFNMIGTSGDTFEPDVLGIRHRALVGAAVNWASAELGLGDGFAAAPYAELNAKAREHISQAASAFLPGWLSQPVRPKANDSGTIAESSFERLIESRIIRNNPNLTNQELFDIMNDPNSEQYSQAHKEIARSGILNQFLSFTIPIGIKARESSTDVRSAALGEVYDTATKLGIKADEVSPAKDAEFAQRYKAKTGRDWKPSDFDQDRLERSLYSATAEARPYILQLEQYNNLGTEVGKNGISMYYKVKNGEVQPFGEQPKTEWDDAADRWLGEQSPRMQSEIAETQALQTLFRQVHPEIGQYKDWTGQMSYLEKLSGGSLAVYRERVSRGNPNAAAYFEAKKNENLKKHKNVDDFLESMDRATTSFDAYLAVTGIAKQKFDQRPLPTNNNQAPYDPAQSMVDQEQPGGGGFSPQPENKWETFLQGF